MSADPERDPCDCEDDSSFATDLGVDPKTGKCNTEMREVLRNVVTFPHDRSSEYLANINSPGVAGLFYETERIMINAERERTRLNSQTATDAQNASPTYRQQQQQQQQRQQQQRQQQQQQQCQLAQHTDTTSRLLRATPEGNYPIPPELLDDPRVISTPKCLAMPALPGLPACLTATACESFDRPNAHEETASITTEPVGSDEIVSDVPSKKSDPKPVVAEPVVAESVVAKPTVAEAH